MPSPTEGVPQPTPAPPKPKIIRCPACNSTIFRNGELKSKGDRFKELETLEEKLAAAEIKIRELEAKLKEKEPANTPPTPTPPSPANAPKRRGFLIYEADDREERGSE